jgi:hypothetical protein
LTPIRPPRSDADPVEVVMAERVRLHVPVQTSNREPATLASSQGRGRVRDLDLLDDVRDDRTRCPATRELGANELRALWASVESVDEEADAPTVLLAAPDSALRAPAGEARAQRAREAEAEDDEVRILIAVSIVVACAMVWWGALQVAG